MLAIIIIASGLALFGVVIAAAKRAESSVTRTAWERIARDLRLSLVPSDRILGMTMAGRFDGFDVEARVALGEAHQFGYGVEIRVRVPNLDTEIGLEPVRQPSSQSDPDGRIVAPIHDPQFQSRYVARGGTAATLSLLRGEARHALIELGGVGRVSIRGAHLRLSIPRVPTSLEEMSELLRKVTNTARLLAQQPAASPQSLAEVAMRDPVDRVRAQALETLASDFRSDPVFEPTLRLAEGDASPWVRYAAAVLCGDAGRPVLESLATEASPVQLAAWEQLLATAPLEACVHLAERVHRCAPSSSERARVLETLLAAARSASDSARQAAERVVAHLSHSESRSSGAVSLPEALLDAGALSPGDAGSGALSALPPAQPSPIRRPER